MSMDRREAIKTAAALAFVSGANPGVIKPPPLSKERREKFRREWEKLYSSCWLSPNEIRACTIAGRNKWRIVDQMIEEHGDGEE